MYTHPREQRKCRLKVIKGLTKKFEAKHLQPLKTVQSRRDNIKTTITQYNPSHATALFPFPLKT